MRYIVGTIVCILFLISCGGQTNPHPIDSRPDFWPSAVTNLVAENKYHVGNGDFTRFTYSSYVFLEIDPYITGRYVYIYAYDNAELRGQPIWHEWYSYKEGRNEFLTDDFRFSHLPGLQLKGKTLWFVASIKVTARKQPFVRYSQDSLPSNSITF